MPQLLLFPDPRPLVERLGQAFFRQAPSGPGVYLMRDAADQVLYVGKAKNLRKRLASYRVANPDRLPRRHLRLLRAVSRIELEACPSESAALAREAELLHSLRPRFNRAGTWVGPARFLAWRATAEGLELAVTSDIEAGWTAEGPLGAGAWGLRHVLVRLLWCAAHPSRGLAGMPAGWFRRLAPPCVTIPKPEPGAPPLEELVSRLSGLFGGQAESFAEWIRGQTANQARPFETTLREEDIEWLSDFTRRKTNLVSAQDSNLHFAT